MIKILQARLQPYVNWELPDVQTEFRKGRATRDQIANIPLITEKAREFQKKKKIASLTMLNPFTVGITTNCVNYTEMGIPNHLTYLLRNVCRSRSNRTERGIMDWFQIGKGVCQGCISLPRLFKLYAEHVMRNARLDEAQAGIKIAGRNINNLR